MTPDACFIAVLPDMEGGGTGTNGCGALCTDGQEQQMRDSVVISSGGMRIELTGAHAAAAVLQRTPTAKIVDNNQNFLFITSKSVNNNGNNDMGPMRMLSTGGAGYIGSISTLQLLQAGREVLVRMKQLARRAPAFCEGDVCDGLGTSQRHGCLSFHRGHR